MKTNKKYTGYVTVGMTLHLFVDCEEMRQFIIDHKDDFISICWLDNVVIHDETSNYTIRL